MSNIHQVARPGVTGGVASSSDAGGHANHNSVSGPPAFSAQLASAMEKPAQKLPLTKPNASSTNSYGPTNSQGISQKPAGSGHHSSSVNGSASGHDFYERALRLFSYRQELLASNIANADTPGYKAVDIEVGKALLSGLDKGTVPLKYYVPSQGSVDGNTVEMDAERAKFMENAIRYEFAVSRVRDHYMMMSDLLKNTPY